MIWLRSVSYHRGKGGTSPPGKVETYTHNPCRGFGACYRDVLSLLQQAKRLLIWFRELAVVDFIEHRFGIFALLASSPNPVDVVQQ